MKYSKHVDYLIASVIYMATHKRWWARTPTNLGKELSLDAGKLRLLFEGFPGIFRKSPRPSGNGEHYYSLQARYAQRTDYTAKEEKIDIPPLDTDKTRLIYDFILKSADDERTRVRTWTGNGIAVTAAVISAIAAIITTYLRSAH